MSHDDFTPKKSYGERLQAAATSIAASAAQRAKITEKVHKPPRNHYIEWPVFSDIGLNCESQGEKGRTCKKYKILVGSRVLFFHFIHDLPFSPGHLLESEERFVNLFCNFSPLCGMLTIGDGGRRRQVSRPARRKADTETTVQGNERAYRAARPATYIGPT